MSNSPSSAPPRRRWRALRRVAAIAGLLLCLVALAGGGVYIIRAPVFRWIGGQLVHSDPPVPSDAIVVLSGGVPEREIEAADLYRAGYAPIVVLTQEPENPGLLLLRRRGVKVETGLEERLRYLRELGVPALAVQLLSSDIADSTSKEADLVRRWAHQVRVRRLIIVTSAFHTGRARFVFQRAMRGDPVELRFRPASADAFGPDTWWRSRLTLTRGLIEWQKLIAYRILY